MEIYKTEEETMRQKKEDNNFKPYLWVIEEKLNHKTYCRNTNGGTGCPFDAGLTPLHGFSRVLNRTGSEYDCNYFSDREVFSKPNV